MCRMCLMHQMLVLLPRRTRLLSNELLACVMLRRLSGIIAIIANIILGVLIVLLPLTVLTLLLIVSFGFPLMVPLARMAVAVETPIAKKVWA